MDKNMNQDENRVKIDLINAYIKKSIKGVMNNDIEKVKIYLQWLKENAGQQVNSLKDIRDINGNSILHWAALKSPEMLNTVLLFASNEDIDTVDTKLGETPLHWAVANNMLDNFTILISKGANINFVSKNGVSILKAAQQCNSSEMVDKVNEILIYHRKLTNFKLEDYSVLKDTIIFVSNSLLDGFREGDGDLMDKIVINLHQLGISAIRVIENNQKVPDDRKTDLQTGSIITLSTTSNEDIKKLQSNFLSNLNRYKGKNIILYIGSRIDAVVDKQKHIIVGSGSLYTDDFLNSLKKFGVKIVICCLEFKFYKRSLKVLPICYEMIRQHLFQSDMIHFLTEHDKSNFEKTLTILKNNQLLRPHKSITCSISELPNMSGEIKQLGGNVRLDELKNNGVFISGIYTVNPLSLQQILQGEEVTENNKNDLLIHKLNSRPNNILCLGLIRGNKGFEEAIALGKKFGEQNKPYQIFIVGRVMESGILLFRDMLVNMFDLSKNNINKNLISIYNENKNHYNLSADKLNLSISDVAVLTKVFQDNKENLNKFLQLVFNTFKLKYPQNGQFFNIYLNINEVQIHEIAMKCKYAIKLDHKGMANNASTIVSCLGLFLPTFTASSLVTGNEFQSPIHHQSFNSLHAKDKGKYALTVIMPKKIYVNDNGEVKPKNFEISDIISIIDNDQHMYLERLKQLIELYASKLFDSMNVTKQLCEKLFIPLTLNSQQRESISSTNNLPDVKVWSHQQVNTLFTQVQTDNIKNQDYKKAVESKNDKDNERTNTGKTEDRGDRVTEEQSQANVEQNIISSNKP